jgi:hypothetical protein
MYRELLSWIGLFTSQKDLLKFISKRDQNHQPSTTTRERDHKNTSSTNQSTSGANSAGAGQFGQGS